MATQKSTPEGAAQEVFAAFGDVSTFTDAARDQYETAMKSFNENAEKFRAQTEQSMSSAREGFTAASDHLRTVSADALTHAREEMTEAVDFANELARAKSINDAMELQRKYWTKLFETRVERARAYTQASVDASRSAFEPLNKSFTTAFAFDKFFPFASK